MRNNEVVGRKRERALMFQKGRLFREGIPLTSPPPRVLADRQMVALHAIRLDHAADWRRLQDRFELHRGPIDDVGGHMDHPTVRAFFDHDRVAQVGWGGAAGLGQTPTCSLTGRCAPHTVHLQEGRGIVWQCITGKERDRPIGRRLQPKKQAARLGQGALPDHPSGHQFVHTTWKVMSQISDTLKNSCFEIKGLRKQH